jgi:hypothetical protein
MNKRGRFCPIIYSRLRLHQLRRLLLLLLRLLRRLQLRRLQPLLSSRIGLPGLGSETWAPYQGAI